METGMARFEFHRNGIFKKRQLLLVQEALDRRHIPGQCGRWQKIPVVTLRYVVDTAVFLRTVIQGNPAGQVCHRPRPLPVGIILVPGNRSTVPGWFTEKLVVLKSGRPPRAIDLPAA